MTAEKSCRGKLHFGNKKTFVDYSSTTRRLISWRELYNNLKLPGTLVLNENDH